MSWTTPDDLKAQLTRMWNRGQLPALLVTGESNLPLRLSLKGPNSSDVTERFEAVRAWTTTLAAMPHIQIRWREVQHRVQGSQRLAEQVWVDTVDDALTLTGKRRDAQRLRSLVETTRAQRPELLPWLARRALRAIELADEWPRLLAIIDWLSQRPRPSIYLRQVDIPGVHSKFIEAHRATLAELLDLALPADAIVAERTGVNQFVSRYGFLDKPTRVRFRVLDEHISILPLGGFTHPDITLDALSFAGLNISVSRVFITENETNYLAFPPTPYAIVIFGAGYGWEALAKARWLAGCSVHYWGDIDTHGFAILDQLRHHLKHVLSFLMDRATLDRHEVHWGEESEQVLRDLPELNEAETVLYNELRDNRIRKNLRLEQERIGFDYVRGALARINS